MFITLGSSHLIILAGGGGQENLGGENLFNQWQGGWMFFHTLTRGRWIFLMPHCQTFLINVIKRLFSWKTIEFWYIKYKIVEGKGGIVYALGEGVGSVILFAHVKEVVILLSHWPNFNDDPRPNNIKQLLPYISSVALVSFILIFSYRWRRIGSGRVLISL